jgi:hypothetical protein
MTRVYIALFIQCFSIILSINLKIMSMKKLFFTLFLAALSFGAYSQDAKIDSTAVLLLDRMSDIIGDLGSCSFNLNTSYDTLDPDHGLIKQFGTYEVHMSGPDKMQVISTGAKGHRQFWYNGSQLSYYSYDENNYAVMDAPPTTLLTIDSINKNFGVDFPAADFFYPTFTDDLIRNSDQIAYLGQTRIMGRDCFQILAKSKLTTIQIWISNDAFNLPLRYSITYRNIDGNPQYEATFSHWQVNPDLPVDMFNFMPPPGATKIRMISKSEN